MGSREQMNMGGERSTTSAFVQLNNVLDSLVNKVNTLRSGGAGFAASMAAGAQKISAASGDVDGGGGGNQVFNQPPVPPPPASTVAGMGGGGFGNRIGNYISDNRGAIGATAFGATYTALPAVNDAVTMDYLIGRTRFFGGGGGTASGDPSYRQTTQTTGFNPPELAHAQALEVQRRQQVLAKSGVMTNPLDAAKGFLAAQAGGIGQSFMTDQMIKGVGAMSALTPGVGGERSMQAMVSMQQPRNVNLLAFMGIQARDPLTGQPKDPKAIAQQIWDKINREKMGSEPLTAADLDTAFLPGNSLDSMMKMYFGNDEVVISQIKAFLYAKVSGVTKMTKKELKKYGALSGYVESQAIRTAEAQQQLQQISGAEAKGAATGNVVATGFSKVINQLDRLTGLLGLLAFGKGGLEALKGIPILGSLIPGKADGGPVAGTKPYIVGEKGPELFVPKVNGTIVPNHKINRGDGGDVSKFGPKVTPTEWAKQLASGLGIKDPSAETIDALTTWMRFEGGHWKNTANYNPLNTTLRKPGSTSMNDVGVQSYTSLDTGLQATIDTLTGKNAKQRGYTAIIKALKSGDKDKIFAAINNSAWRTGETGGAGSYKGLSGSSGGDYGYDRDFGITSGSSSFASQAGAVGTFKDFITQNPAIAGDFAKQSGQGGGNVITININGYNKSGKELAKEVAKILDDPTKNAGKN